MKKLLFFILFTLMNFSYSTEISKLTNSLNNTETEISFHDFSNIHGIKLSVDILRPLSSSYGKLDAYKKN